MKKVIAISLSAILALLLVLGTSAYLMFRKEIGVINTIKMINDNPRLYTMQYYGDYGFDGFLAQGGAKSNDELAEYLTSYISKGFYKHTVTENSGGCSTIAAENESGERVFGRNFDWEDCAVMIVETAPPNGYRSISTVNLYFIGYSPDYLPDSLFNSVLALGAPYAPLDGMNEKGLCVADLIIEDAGETHQDTGKPNITTTTAIRLLLDYAATVDEAIALLEQYNMHSDMGIMHHLAISDATGRSIVVEYIDNIMFVTDAPVVTNFFLTPGEWFGFGGELSKQRYDILYGAYTENEGILDEQGIKNILREVRSTNGFEPQWVTQWSAVYSQSAGTVTFYLKEDFEKEYGFQVYR
ncbi:MAG: linear amide C-N hydrolase [Lachnospiraceae bacterium]|nr:linear amide C-N hydrolase [Lachnospiraceae bacterium]